MYEIEDFEKDVILRSYETPVVVDFWAQWCGPCKILGPILESLSDRHANDWILAKVDTERYPDESSRFGVRSIPNVKMFVEGKVIDEFIGALPEAEVVKWLAKSLPSKYRFQLDGARELLLSGKSEQARETLQTVIASEPNNFEAILLIGQSCLSIDPDLAVKTIEDIKLGTEFFDQAETIRTLARIFNRVSGSGTLPESPVRDKYFGAIQNARDGNFENAIEGFLESIREDRYYDNDTARIACVAIFKLLGEENPITKKQRSNFSRALY